MSQLSSLQWNELTCADGNLPTYFERQCDQERQGYFESIRSFGRGV